MSGDMKLFDDISTELLFMSHNRNNDLYDYSMFDFTLSMKGVRRRNQIITERPVWVSGYIDDGDCELMQVSFIDELGYVCKFWCKEIMRNNINFLRGLPVKCKNAPALSSYFCVAIGAYFKVLQEESRERAG